MNIGDNWNGWTVESLLGQGTYGTVYKIIRTDFSYTVESALKVISIPQNDAEILAFRNEGMSDMSITTYYRDMVEEIMSEFVIMSELKGTSNIVCYEDHYYEKKKDGFGWDIYIRMELLTPLFEYMRGHDFTIRDAINLGIDICKALEICQQFNIIHRDIKPDNIFVSKFNDFKIGDFGIARKLEAATASMSKKGTFSYMAPEVYKGQSYNATVDIYSLGIVMYRILNGNRLPFYPPYPEPIHFSDRDRANIRRFSGEELSVPVNADGKLAEIVLKACAYDPKDRYDTPSAMREALESIEYSEDFEKVINPAREGVFDDEDETKTIDEYDDEYSTWTIDAQEVKEEKSLPEEADSSGNIDSESVDGPKTSTSQMLAEESSPEGGSLNENDTLPEDEPEPEDETEDEPEPETEPEEGIGSEEGPEDHRSETKGRKTVLVIIAAVCLLIGGFGFYKFLFRTVPDVIGMDAAKAEETIANNGLTCSETREFSDSIDRNIVIAQTEKGKTVKKNTKIKLTVSAGVPVSVPDLTGLAEEEAREKAEKAGLSIAVAGEELTDNIQKGNVAGQTPEPGSDCEIESEIKVIISKGIVQVEVPNVVGKTTEEAQSALEETGLVCDSTTQYSSEPVGNVIAQSVEGGTLVDKYSAVTITVSSGPAPKASSSGSSKKKSKKKKSKKEVEWS